jgi:hypothetical protein
LAEAGFPTLCRDRRVDMAKIQIQGRRTVRLCMAKNL